MNIIKLVQGDIIKMQVDAVVNAANTSLLGGGGVDGAIHKAGGPKVLEECIAIRNKQGGCKTGEAVITTGGNLAAKYIIHTVGPVWNGGNSNETQLLASAYRNSLLLAIKYSIRTIAFPNISTGIYHFPKQKAAMIAFNTAMEFLKEDIRFTEINFVCFDEENYIIYESLMEFFTIK
ncbi:MAG: O-acetyl-ADP-ribose deacetylase [Panacibacter sp.]